MGTSGAWSVLEEKGGASCSHVRGSRHFVHLACWLATRIKNADRAGRHGIKFEPMDLVHFDMAAFFFHIYVLDICYQQLGLKFSSALVHILSLTISLGLQFIVFKFICLPTKFYLF